MITTILILVFLIINIITIFSVSITLFIKAMHFVVVLLHIGTFYRIVQLHVIYHLSLLITSNLSIFEKRLLNRIVIVISRLLEGYLNAKRTSAPAFSRALQRNKEGLPRGWSREAHVRFPEGHEGTE